MNLTSKLLSKEFQTKINMLKEDIKKQFKERNYTLPDELDVDSLIGWNNFDGSIKIYPSVKCPVELEGFILSLILEHFPNNTQRVSE